MKILMLTDGIQPFAIGGMQKHSQQVAKYFAMSGHKITLLHCVYGKEKRPSTEEVASLFGAEASKNIESFSFSFPRLGVLPGHYIRESYLYSKNLYEHIKPHLSQYDFVYAKGFSAWYFIERKQRGEKMPPIGIKFHGYEMFQKPANFKMRMEHYMLRGPVRWNTCQADFVFSYGGKITSLIRKLGVEGSRILEVPSGISPEALLPTIPERPQRRWLFIGRYERRKGIEEIQDAIAALGPDFGVEFHFIGPIPAGRRLKLKNLVYHGLIKDREEINKIMDSCEILIAPSHSEGMPNVILEAMSRGMAIITTDVGAVSIVVDDSCGWFTKPGDVRSLIGVMNQAKNVSQNGIKEKCLNSLRSVEKLTWPKVIKLLEAEMQRVV